MLSYTYYFVNVEIFDTWPLRDKRQHKCLYIPAALILTITAVLCSIDGLLVLNNRPIRDFAWDRKLTFQMEIVVTFLS
jgi:hypothetical protein